MTSCSTSSSATRHLRPGSEPEAAAARGLAQVPLVPALREGADTGTPIAVADPAGEAATAVAVLAERLLTQRPARVRREELRVRVAT